jgi:hypothetical protein
MNIDTDIAWLAGVFDGEGCVYVLNARRPSGRVVSSLMLIMTNTSAPLVEKYIATLDKIGIRPNVNIDTKQGTRPLYFVKVSRKRDMLMMAKTIVGYTTAKRAELGMAIWYLERACKVRQYVATEDDKAVLQAISDVKHNKHVPSQVERMLEIN